MSKLNKKFKDTILLTTLATAITLTGCSKKDENKEKVYESIGKEITTELQSTEEYVNEVFQKEEKYTSLAEQSYNEYKEFYDSIGVSIPQIENMIKIIKDDFYNISEGDLIDTIQIINHILLSEELGQSLDNVDSGIRDNFDVSKTPKLSIYVENEKIKSDLEKYEIIRDQIINSVNNGMITDEDKELLRDSIINMENAYNEDQGYMNGTIICEGNKYLQASWKYNLVVLAAKGTGETEIKDNNGNIYPICTTAEETNIIAQYNMLSYSGESIPESLQMQYTNIKLRQIITKYEQNMCSIEEELYKNIKSYDNVDQIEIKVETLKSLKKNTLKQIKFAFENYKENQKSNNDIKIKMLQI